MVCGMELPFQIPTSNLIFIDQRITCGKPVEPRFYKCDFSGGIPCRKCGDDLDEDAVVKFNKLKLDFNTVLPCCSSASCATGPHDGWKMSGKTKRNIRGRKRKKKTLDIDLKTFKPRPLGNSIDTLQLWLADSKLAWNQLRELLSTHILENNPPPCYYRF